MKDKSPNQNSKFVESVFTPVSLVLISIVAIVAVAVALFQVNKGPLAPTAPSSQPAAAELSSGSCAIAFDVAGPSITPSDTPVITEAPTNTPNPSETPVPTATSVATATPGPSSTPTNTPTSNQADLSLTKRASNNQPKVGENTTFTIEVYNAGPSQATNVTVYDPIPGGLTVVKVTPSQGSYNISTGIWTIGTINVGETKTLQVEATVNVVGTITNTAQVQHSDQSDPDSTPGNNNPNEDDQKSTTLNGQTAPNLPKAGNNSRTTLFVIATGTIVLIIGAMGLLLLL